MRIPDCINTPRLELRLLSARDAEEVLSYVLRNRSLLEPTEPKRTDDYWTLRGVRELLGDERRGALDSGRHIRYWIVHTQRFQVIGSVLLARVTRKPPAGCSLGYRLDREHLRRGYMKEALAAVLDWAFGDFGLERIEVNMMPRNTASRKTAASLGFRKCGITRDFLEINGTLEHHIRTELYREEWLCSRRNGLM